MLVSFPVRVSSCHPSFFLIFSFYSYVGPRDLHSFPTRRSSDLRSTLPAVPPFGRSLRIRRRSDCRTTADRKSTRLNSSHQIISYAVFCLKKKNHPAKTTKQIHSRPHPCRNHSTGRQQRMG